ncbi:hypothetical protein B1757_09705 [Acidithiobacillus marinus]|uniref:NADH:quinone oxidoreductase/Mrp antiporter membrane subunit domain-containing protein n=1 Tax=Acidithiobacillus marinus TaxID=187490 RepID=A0A2I1DKG3_9PROT|nr:hypothetical protein [Acidithiobacillus marinus]PKY10370.1 hypothetical protein B1757_09705 [Acidithiobacillus marinus]
MHIIIWIIAGALLPWFPFSWIFNRLLVSAPGAWARALAVLVLPQLGLLLLLKSGAWMSLGQEMPQTLRALALFTAILYAYRAAGTRDVQIWARLMATSGLSLTWLLVGLLPRYWDVQFFVLAWSIPAALMLLWAGILTQRTGGSYLGLTGGFARVMPRLSVLMSLTALAATATPVFPNFFALLQAMASLPISWMPLLLLVLLLWGWTVGRLLQDLLFGIYRGEPVDDLSVGGTWLGGLTLGVFALVGLFWGGIWIIN